MMRWLVLRFKAPLASFGGVTIDSRGVTRDFPAASAITGLLANALGYARYETDRLERLQARLVFGARRDSEHSLGRMTDFQTAKLEANDKGWTTYGRVEGRAGGASTYDSPHIRWRDYHADTDMTVVLCLSPTEESPDLDAVAAALDRPARPLFFGRKSCLPAGYLLRGDAGRWVDADDAHAALTAVAGRGEMPALWPAASGEGRAIADRRNWRSGLHGGTRRVMEGRMTPVDRS